MNPTVSARAGKQVFQMTLTIERFAEAPGHGAKAALLVGTVPDPDRHRP